MTYLTILAKSFLASASRLDASQKQRLEEFVARLQSNPESPGLGLSEIAGASGPGFWMARLGQNHAVVIHRDADQYVLLLAGTPDECVRWSTENAVKKHAVTGATQIYRLPQYIDVTLASPSEAFMNFAAFEPSFLLALGVPSEWVEQVRAIADEESFFSVYEQMPEESAEYLYALTLGQEVEPPRIAPTPPRFSDNSDNLRRLYPLSDSESLTEVLSRPFEQWMLFLHPSQRALAEQDFNGPSKITGSAGTGKTVVALHRARNLAAAGKKVLLTTFTNRLKQNIEERINQLCSAEQRALITVDTVNHFALDLAKRLPDPRITGVSFDSDAKSLIEQLAPQGTATAELKFMSEEWVSVIDRQGLASWDEYRDADRTGRGLALQESRRETYWQTFDKVLARMKQRGRPPFGLLCRIVRESLEAGRLSQRFDAVIVDEVQDLNTQEIRLLAALCGDDMKDLMLIGDAGQRIYPGGFSLRKMGIDIRGRSRLLTINYRTTQEIERAARALRSHDIEDLDGGTERAVKTQNLMRGSKPIMCGFPSNAYDEENSFVVNEIKSLLAAGVGDSEIAVLARTKRILGAFQNAVRDAGVPVRPLDDQEADRGVALCTMHSAKGLEFRHVFIIACRDNAIPPPSLLRNAVDARQKEEIEQRERTLLYVAMTRARDQLWITWTGNPSLFLNSVEEFADVKFKPISSTADGAISEDANEP